MEENGLTPAEVEILGHLAHGLAEAQAARRMSMSEATLRRNLARAREKLGATSTTNAVYIAARRGLI